MRKYFLILFSLFIFFANHNTVSAQDAHLPVETFYRARVTQIIEEGQINNEGITNEYQLVKLVLLDNPDAGKEISLEHGGKFTLTEKQKVKTGDKVVLIQFTYAGEKPEYQIIDKYRLDVLISIATGFIILVLAIAHFKGLGSLLGLAISFLVIVKFIVPQILAGRDPLLISTVGAIAIVTTTIYLAHGFTKKTTVALIATLASLTLTASLAVFFVQVSKLTGLGNESAYSLRFGGAEINFKGLLLGGIIIGALGVLDDITTAQSAAVYELKKANDKLGFSSLLERGLNIGREHITSLVNTLVLAYAGASLPIFLAFVLNPSKAPVWSVLNSEFIAEEIIRTLTGSVGLVLAIPITTILAAYFASKSNNKL